MKASRLALFFFLFAATSQCGVLHADERPNVLWIYLEDVSGWFSCYGDEVIETPNIDALAERGTRFDRFYTCAGVCSAMRSGTITGMMQTSIGAHQHRSSRATFRGLDLGPKFDANHLPDHVKTIPELFRAAGYYTFNEGGGKDDFNFIWNEKDIYDHRNKRWGFKGAKDGSEWTGRAKDQPFFGQIQLAGGKSGGNAKKQTDRAKVSVPPYYPDIPLVREEIAHHYDCLLLTDQQVGQIIAALKRDGLHDNTVIFMFSDHGYKLHRHKQFLYEGGIHMPCIVAGPGQPAGKVRDDLISSIDVGPASLAVAGIEVPGHMEGRDFLADDYEPRGYVISARDRCDYTIERIRAVVTPKYKYLRNYLTDRPYMQPSYKDPWPVSKKFRQMMADGEMNQTQLIFFGKTKPKEELYDLANDPHEIHNLADDPKFAKEVQRHRDILKQWIEQTGDQGQKTESDAGLLAALKRWGDKCVNPEYDRVRPQWEAWKKERAKQGARGDSGERGEAAGQLQAGMGMMVGEVTSTGALVQMRLTTADALVDGDVPGGKGIVNFVVRRAEDNKTMMCRKAEATPDHDFIARVRFEGLSPNVAYKCETFFAGAKGEKHSPGPVAMFKTLAGAKQEATSRFVVVTGMNYAKFHGDDRIDKKQHLEENNTALPRPYAGKDKHLGYPGLESIRKLKPDFFIGTGDNVYYDTPDDPRAKTIPELRQKWHEQFVQPRFRDLFAEMPTYWQVDDHDYRIDDGDNSGDYDPSPELAQRMMREQLPYAPMGDGDAKTYRTHRVSKDLQLWFVENRIYRSPNKMPDGPKKSIWGEEQKAWLKQTLADSDATFKLLISPNPMIGPDDARKTDNHTNIGGFQHERDEFFAWLKESGVADDNFYIVCGDRHWQYHSVHPSGIEEFSCGALVDANSRLGRKPGDPKSTDPDATIKQLYSQDPRSGGFLLIEANPAQQDNAATLRFLFHDEHGKRLHKHTKTARS